MPVPQELFTNTEDRMSRSVEALRHELASVRTGRATPALVEHLRVDYFGTPTPLNHLASITAPDGSTLVIQPWDRTVLPAVERAILKSELGLTPASDGTVIRLSLPPLSEERRDELVRVVRRKVEEGKIAIRNIRRDALEHLRTMERNKEISQDENRRAQEQLQKLTDRYTVQMEALGAEKEQEVRQF